MIVRMGCIIKSKEVGIGKTGRRVVTGKRGGKTKVMIERVSELLEKPRVVIGRLGCE